MKKKFILFFTLFFYFFSYTYSQPEQFQKGQIITFSGDTLNGYIKKVDKYQRALYVVFKETRKSEEVKYTPEEVHYYRIGNLTYYQSVSASISNLTGLKNEQNKKLFLRKLVEGEVELYRLDYEIDNRQSPAYEYSNFYYLKDGVNKIIWRLKRNQYSERLRKELKDKCDFNHYPEKKLKYNDRTLINFTKKYNDCIGKKSTVLFGNDEGSPTSIGFNLGPASSVVKTSDEYLSQFDLVNKMGYNINVFVDLPMWDRYLEVRGGVSFVYRKAVGDSTHIVPNIHDNAGEKLDLQAEMILSKLYLPLQFKVNLTKNKPLTPYFLAGIYFGTGINNNVFYDKTTFKINNGVSTEVKIRENDPYTPTVLLGEYGWKFGGGIEFDITLGQKVFLETHVSLGGNNNSYIRDKITNRTIALMIGYIFR